jgi:hypothetical protein
VVAWPDSTNSVAWYHRHKWPGTTGIGTGVGVVLRPRECRGSAFGGASPIPPASFSFLFKAEANLKLQYLEIENSDRHKTNFIGKGTTRATQQAFVSLFKHFFLRNMIQTLINTNIHSTLKTHVRTHISMNFFERPSLKNLF